MAQCTHWLSAALLRPKSFLGDFSNLPHSYKFKFFQKDLDIRIGTFPVEYKENLSFIGKFLLNNFKNKEICYAIDDIIYELRSDPIERDNLLSILHSIIISLQNNFAVDFFQIWITEVYIDQTYTSNKFFNNKFRNQSRIITFKIAYTPGILPKKQEPLW